MDLKGIISVSGMSGLYKVIAQTKNGFIVEALSDKKRTPIQSSNKVSALEDISVFKTDGEIPLTEVFKQIIDKKGPAFAYDPKADSKLLRDYFKSFVPDFDEEKVYTSDIKKIFNWFLLLKDQITEAPEKVEKTPESESADKKTKIKAEPKTKVVTKVAKTISPKIKSSEPKQSTKAVRTQKKG
jgi:hypothetical protein